MFGMGSFEGGVGDLAGFGGWEMSRCMMCDEMTWMEV